jgi:hypothetical protein
MLTGRGRACWGRVLRWVLPPALALATGATLRVEMTRLAPPFVITADSADYFSAAMSLLEGGELQLALKRPPLYPDFLAGVMGLVGPSLDRRVAFQHGMELLTIALSYLIGGTSQRRATSVARP